MTGDAPLLAVTDLVKRFGGLQVIEELNFIVARGARVGLIGPNGAGKTTVFNLVTGVYRVDRGRILLDGDDITDLPAHRRVRYGLARNFQNIRLMRHLTALENVVFGQHSRALGLRGLLQPIRLFRHNPWRDEARAALEEWGLGNYSDLAVATLPYGVQKRVELVRAMMARPKLLMLDEPAAGLNPSETDALRLHLERISDAGVTLLVVEHDMPFITALCQRIIVLNFGRKIAEGTAAEIRAAPAVREAYLGRDAGVVEGKVLSHVS